MRKRLTSLVLFAALAGAAPLAAQGAFGIGASGIFSLESGGGSNFGATALYEWMGANGFGFRADGSYFFDPGFVNFDADVAYRFMTASTSRVHPYILAGGSYTADDSFDNGRFGVNAGAGFNFMMQNSSLMPFVEARFIYSFEKDLQPSTSNLLATAGVKFGMNR